MRVKTMAALKYDFGKAQRQITELIELSEEVRRTTDSEYASVIQQIPGIWQGAGADEFMRKASILQEELENVAKEIRKTAAAFTNVAQRVKKAEERAALLAAKQEL